MSDCSVLLYVGVLDTDKFGYFVHIANGNSDELRKENEGRGRLQLRELLFCISVFENNNSKPKNGRRQHGERTFGSDSIKFG